MSETLLEIRDLCAGYVLEDGVTETVKAVSLSVAEGEILGIAGESGCGKSTSSRAFSVSCPLPASSPEDGCSTGERTCCI